MNDEPALGIPITTDFSVEQGRPTWCEINLETLVSNYQRICDFVNPNQSSQNQPSSAVSVTPVIKANAYGHGLAPCALALQAAGAENLAVAYVEEGVALRQAGVTANVHVLGGAVTRQIPLFLDYNLTFTAPSIDKLRQIDSAATASGRTARAHLKIDTGMERIGVHYYNADQLLEAALECQNVDIVGVFSHFSDADEDPRGSTQHLPKTEQQLERFLTALSFYDRHNHSTPKRHLANSAAIARAPATHLDMVRPGIALFGIGPWAKKIGTKPVLSWQSEVIFFKVIPADTPVGYGGIWASDRQTRVITLPVGYADGYKRTMSHSAQVIVNGKRCQTIGNICMDQTMVDIGPDGTAYNGDKVIFVGCDPETGEAITIEDLAKWAGTSVYEVITSISARVPRRYLPTSQSS